MGAQDQTENPLPHTFGTPQQKSDESQQCNLPQTTTPPPPYERGYFGVNLPLPHISEPDPEHLKLISNVYRIITYQFVVVVATLFVFTFDYSTVREIHNSPGVWWLSLNTMAVTLILMGYYGEKRRLWPKTAFALFTFAITFFLGCTVATLKSSYHDDDSPIVSFFFAAVSSLVGMFALTKFSIQNRRNISVKRSLQLLLAVCFLTFGAMCMLDPFDNPIPAFLGFIESMVFTTYVVYYTQITLKEGRKNTVTSAYRADGDPDSEHIIASLDMYINVFQSLFNFIFNFFKLTKDEITEKSKDPLGQGTV